MTDLDIEMRKLDELNQSHVDPKKELEILKPIVMKNNVSKALSAFIGKGKELVA